jgi:hypothetical protein
MKKASAALVILMTAQSALANVNTICHEWPTCSWNV